MCEHHMLPFFSAYCIYSKWPNCRTQQNSKNCRCTLEEEERLTDQIKKLYSRGAKPLGVAVVIEAQHVYADERNTKQNSVTTLQFYRCI
jgi:GTP cyclohydrolase I